MKRTGTRIQVMHGTAKQTGGGLKKKDLKYNKHGKIVSKKASAVATKKMKGGGQVGGGVFYFLFSNIINNVDWTTENTYVVGPINNSGIESFGWFSHKNITRNERRDAVHNEVQLHNLVIVIGLNQYILTGDFEDLRKRTYRLTCTNVVTWKRERLYLKLLEPAEYNKLYRNNGITALPSTIVTLKTSNIMNYSLYEVRQGIGPNNITGTIVQIIPNTHGATSGTGQLKINTVVTIDTSDLRKYHINQNVIDFGTNENITGTIVQIIHDGRGENTGKLYINTSVSPGAAAAVSPGAAEAVSPGAAEAVSPKEFMMLITHDVSKYKLGQKVSGMGKQHNISGIVVETFPNEIGKGGRIKLSASISSSGRSAKRKPDVDDRITITNNSTSNKTAIVLSRKNGVGKKTKYRVQYDDGRESTIILNSSGKGRGYKYEFIEHAALSSPLGAAAAATEPSGAVTQSNIHNRGAMSLANVMNKRAKKVQTQQKTTSLSEKQLQNMKINSEFANMLSKLGVSIYSKTDYFNKIQTLSLTEEEVIEYGTQLMNEKILRKGQTVPEFIQNTLKGEVKIKSSRIRKYPIGSTVIGMARTLGSNGISGVVKNHKPKNDANKNGPGDIIVKMDPTGYPYNIFIYFYTIPQEDFRGDIRAVYVDLNEQLRNDTINEEWEIKWKYYIYSMNKYIVDHSPGDLSSMDTMFDETRNQYRVWRKAQLSELETILFKKTTENNKQFKTFRLPTYVSTSMYKGNTLVHATMHENAVQIQIYFDINCEYIAPIYNISRIPMEKEYLIKPYTLFYFDGKSVIDGIDVYTLVILPNKQQKMTDSIVLNPILSNINT